MCYKNKKKRIADIVQNCGIADNCGHAANCGHCGI